MICMSPVHQTPKRSLVRVTPAMRRWWLERFTLEEIRELAGAIWTAEALPALPPTPVTARPSGVNPWQHRWQHRLHISVIPVTPDPRSQAVPAWTLGLKGPPGLEPSSHRRHPVGRVPVGVAQVFGRSPLPAPHPRPVKPALPLPALRRMRPRRPIAASVRGARGSDRSKSLWPESQGSSGRIGSPHRRRDGPRLDPRLPPLAVRAVGLSIASSRRLPRSLRRTQDRLPIGGDIPDG